MDTTSINLNKETRKAVPVQNSTNPLLQRYFDFCDKQMKYRMTWFLLPALVIPCLFMPVAIYFMLTVGGAGASFSIFLFISMLLFIMNMVANVGGYTTRVTIGLFLITVLWDVCYPVVSLLLL